MSQGGPVSGEHTIKYIDKVSQNCILVTYIILCNQCHTDKFSNNIFKMTTEETSHRQNIQLKNNFYLQ